MLSVIVNTIISFAIGKRFYKLAKQSNRVQSEIRALRHDIEEKFAESIDGFSEPAMDITNMNDDYSSSPDGIKMTPASTTDGDGSETEDIYKEWEAQFGAGRSKVREAVEAVEKDRETHREIKNVPQEQDEEFDNSYEEVEPAPRPSTKKYQPTRSSARVSNKSNSSGSKSSSRSRLEARKNERNSAKRAKNAAAGIGGKLKGAVGKLFPMDEDDE